MVPQKTVFQKKHETKYGLKITQIDPGTSKAVSVICQFCVVFGREEKVSLKRKPTTHMNCFSEPFCFNLYCQHLVKQYTAKWEENGDLTEEQKIQFFSQDDVITYR